MLTLRPRPLTPHSEPKGHPVVFFDGVCGLCDRFVNFLIKADRRRALRFATLQGEFARRIVGELKAGETPRSVVVWDGAQCFERSDAVLVVLRAMGGLWRTVSVPFSLMPRPVRDWLYDFIAVRRYRWFGKKETCRVPTPQERDLFLG